MELIEQLADLMRARRDRNPWLRATLEQLVKDNNREAFREHCQGIVTNLIEGPVPEDLTTSAADELWQEMGG